MSGIDPRVGAARICAEILKAQMPNLGASELAELAGGVVDESAVRTALTDLADELMAREALPSMSAAIAEMAKRQTETVVEDEKPTNVAAALFTPDVILGACAALLADAYIREAWPEVRHPTAKINVCRQDLVAKLTYFYLCGKAGIGA